MEHVTIYECMSEYEDELKMNVLNAYSIMSAAFITYLFKNGLASQVIVFRVRSCVFQPRTSKI